MRQASAAETTGKRKDRQGRIAEWIDDKAYGWIEVEGLRIFAHIKDFDRGQRRPVAGDEVTFKTGVDAQGRACGKGIRLANPSARIGIGAWLFFAGLLVLPVAAGIHLALPPWAVLAWMAVASLVAWGLYAVDKRRAQQGQWRIPESTLHFAELLGGWPGAFLAQRRLRHKTVKIPFQMMFWVIVLLYQLVAADVLLDHAGSKGVVEKLKWGELKVEKGDSGEKGDFSRWPRK